MFQKSSQGLSKVCVGRAAARVALIGGTVRIRRDSNFVTNSKAPSFQTFDTPTVDTRHLPTLTWKPAILILDHRVECTAFWDANAQVSTAMISKGGLLGLPADFLIAADGTIKAVHYCKYACDQWSVDELIEWRGGLIGTIRVVLSRRFRHAISLVRPVGVLTAETDCG